MDLEAQGLIPHGWGHPIRYKILLWCVETGFVLFEGRMLDGWQLPFEYSGTKKMKCYASWQLLACFSFLWLKIGEKSTSRYHWKAENHIFYFIFSKAYYSYVDHTFLINKSKIVVWHLKNHKSLGWTIMSSGTAPCNYFYMITL